MIDSAEARSIISKDLPKINSDIINGFHEYLRKNNKYVRGYQSMWEKIRDEKQAAQEEGREPKEYKLLSSLKEHVCLPPVFRLFNYTPELP